MNGPQSVPREYDSTRPAVKLSPLLSKVFHPPQWLLWLLRWLWPVPHLLGWAAVLRYDDVAEVLTRNDVFKVPFGGEIARLNDGAVPGTPFILGIDDVAEHERQLQLVMQVFRRADVDALVARVSRDAAEKAIAGVREIDAISKLITGVPLEVCRTYFGVKIDDGKKFAYATIDVSGHLFGAPPIEANAAVDPAADYIRAAVDKAIGDAMKLPSGDDTVLTRLVAEHRKGSGLTHNLLRALLLGMIVGFVPTNTMAGGHILEVLLRRKDCMKAAREAAETGDDGLLMHCLFEALRFMPINPGPFRVCSRDYTLAADTPHACWIPKGTKVLASTMSAMFDSRQIGKPWRFDPRRPASDYMHFGYGMHWCVGFYIAQAQIVETFKALLLRPGLRRAEGADGKLKRRGLFPDRLHLTWDPTP